MRLWIKPEEARALVCPIMADGAADVRCCSEECMAWVQSNETDIGHCILIGEDER